MKKLTKNAALLAMVMVMSLTFIQCKDAAVNKFVDLQVEQLNKQCPMNLGNGMTLEKCESTGDKTIKVYTTVTGQMAQAMTFDDNAKQGVLKGLKQSPKEFKQIKEFGISYTYVYTDSDKKVLGEIKITPEDYN